MECIYLAMGVLYREHYGILSIDYVSGYELGDR
jgi:hypothetical protein